MSLQTTPLSQLSSSLLDVSDIVTCAMVQALHNGGETLADKITKHTLNKLEERLAVLQAHIWATQKQLGLEKRTRLVIDTMKQLQGPKS